MEQQSTNLLTYSGAMDTVAVWAVGSAVTTTANANVAPNGTLTATAVFPASTTANLSNTTISTSSSSTAYTVSCYFKSAGKGFAYIQINNGPTLNVGFVTMDLSNGTVGTPASIVGTLSGMSATSTSVGNGWYRLNFTFTTQASSSYIGVYPSISDSQNSRTTTVSTTNGVYMWGAQLEATAFPTSYIPTVASQVTRAADAARITGTNFSSWFNSQQGTAYCSFDTATLSSATQMAYWAIDNGATIGYLIYRPSSTMQINCGNSNTTIGTITAINTTQQYSYSYNTISSMAVSGSLNGATAVSISSPTQLAYVPTQLSLGAFQTSANPMTGHIRKFAYYPVATTATNLQALTGS